MGGIYGVFRQDASLDEEEERFAGWEEEGVVVGRQVRVAMGARARSTLASSNRFFVALAGHFDRSPGTGLSAAQTLLSAWEKEGIASLSRFEGAWVAAIFDRRERRLHLLRDPFGIRRLFSPKKALGLPFPPPCNACSSFPGFLGNLPAKISPNTSLFGMCMRPVPCCGM